MATLRRRDFLRWSPGALLFPLITRKGLAQQPPLSTGLVQLVLEAREAWTPTGPQVGLLYAYNGQIPGPVVEARPGDTVQIRLANLLSEETNLHFHGLHIPPTGRADNGFLRVGPGEEFNYEFTLPVDHPAGTFWYHPHLHGSAARQVSRGLAGCLLVRGDLDRIPEVAAAAEYLLVLQDFDLDSRGYPREPSLMERMMGREGALVTVNGSLQPALAISERGWVRLRFVNASSSRFYRLRIEDHPMFQIATDGGALPGPVEIDELLLVPGERAEVLVEGSRPPASYRIVNLPSARGGMGMGVGMGMGLGAGGMGMGGGVGMGPAGAAWPTETLATLVYEGRDERGIPLPQRLIAFDPLPAASNRRTFRLGQTMGMGAAAFTINGRSFDHQRVDTRVQLGAVEDWEFVNPTGMDHPMHLHTNSFQVVGSDGAALPARKDVTRVPANGRRTVRVKFADFPGRSFYHCHILDHEDLGMMAVLEILD